MFVDVYPSSIRVFRQFPLSIYGLIVKRVNNAAQISRTPSRRRKERKKKREKDKKWFGRKLESLNQDKGALLALEKNSCQEEFSKVDVRERKSSCCQRISIKLSWESFDFPFAYRFYKLD